MAEWQAGVDRTVKNDKAQEVFRDESARFNLSSQFYQEIPNQNLAFVNLMSSATQDESKRRLVRSHVMHSVHQQKQMQEYNDWQVQRAILPMPSSMPLVVHRRPASDPSGMGTLTQQDATEPEFGAAYEDLNWNPTANSVPYQSMHACMALESQGSWTGNMDLELGGSNLGDIQHYGSNYNQDGDAVGLNPRPLQYPFVSPSIEPTSPSSGKIDPFDTLPCLRNGRAQILMYHCKFDLLA